MKPIGVFLAVLAAIAVAVFIFAPERFPAGVGLRDVPLVCSWRPSLVGEGQVVIIANPTGETLRNVHIVCRSSASNEKKEYFEDHWTPEQTKEIGWMEGWRFLSGETVEVSASGYLTKRWTTP